MWKNSITTLLLRSKYNPAIQTSFWLQKTHHNNFWWKYIRNECQRSYLGNMFPAVSHMKAHFGFVCQFFACPIGRASKISCPKNWAWWSKFVNPLVWILVPSSVLPLDKILDTTLASLLLQQPISPQGSTRFLFPRRIVMKYWRKMGKHSSFYFNYFVCRILQNKSTNLLHIKFFNLWFNGITITTYVVWNVTETNCICM